MDTTPFFILLFFHLAFLILGFGSVMVTDLYGLLWMLDRLRFRQVVKVSGVNESFIWIGWAGMVATGIPLIILKSEIDNLMILKFLFVAMIGVNGIMLHLLQKRMESFSGEQNVSIRFMFRLGLALFVSQLAWWGALIIGFLHRHIWNIIDWPGRPWLVSAAIVASLLLIWAVVEACLRRWTGPTSA